MAASRTLPSFAPGLKAVVVGASGGIGGALTRLLVTDPGVASVLAASRTPIPAEPPKLRACGIDLEDEASIGMAAEVAGEEIDLVLVATGVLHGPELQPERSWRALEPHAMRRAFAINTIGPALVAKHFLPRLARGRKTAFAALSARVGSIEDNQLGGWHSYRASKAALNMLVRTLAIELKARRPEAVCVALHPGTVETELSAPFRTSVSRDRLFAPEYSAGRLLEVLDGLGPDDSGRLFAWDGQRVPF